LHISWNPPSGRDWFRAIEGRFFRITVITIFAMPKPFHGHIEIIQRNAIQSWMRLDPGVEVILFGDEHGTAGVCKEFGLRHVPHVGRSEFGAPLLNTVFEGAQRVSKHNPLVYVNCDILLFHDFREALKATTARRERFLMVGRRWDLDITTPLDFSDSSLEMTLRDQAIRNGLQRAEMWIDYFVFPRNLYDDIPPLAIGRRYWDNWLIWKARNIHADVVDATPSVVAIHQNHDYSHHPQGVKGVLHSPESERNFSLAGGWKHLFTLKDANYHLCGDTLQPRRSYWFAPTGRQFSRGWDKVRAVTRVHFWHPLLDATRPIRHAVGLRRAKNQLPKKKPVARHEFDR